MCPQFALSSPTEFPPGLNLKKGSQIAITKFIKNLLTVNNEEIAKNVLIYFYQQLDKIDQSFDNNQLIIDISYDIISAFPGLHVVVTNSPYFYTLFTFLSVNNNLSFFAFRLITLIFQNLSPETLPNLDSVLNWKELLSFFNVVNQNSNADESRFRRMLLFSAMYLRFGSEIFTKFAENGFFNRLFESIDNMSTQTGLFAINCIINGIIHSTPDEALELYQKGALQKLLYFLEMDSNEELTSGILTAIQRLWDICEGKGMSDEFLQLFTIESGFEILMGLETCAEQAQQLSDNLGDFVQ